jgi:hypothetical protein
VTTSRGGDRSVKSPIEITQDDVAKMAGVATKMVTDAKKVLDNNRELAQKILNGEMAVDKAAKQIRKEEKQAEGKGKTEEEEAADVAARSYSTLQEKLLDALTDLKEASSFGHAKEKAKETKERIDAAIENMKKEA